MNNHINKVKKNLNYAKDELYTLIGLLEETIVINDNAFQEEEIKDTINKLNVQINNLTYSIIPAVKRM